MVSSIAAILFLWIIDQSENANAFSLLFLSNQDTVFSVALDTSCFHVSPLLAARTRIVSTEREKWQ